MIISVTSGKGGTGKTTVAAAIGTCLAAMGKKTLCADMDFALPNLDISLGISTLPIMDLGDAVLGRCALEDACIAHPKVENLYLMSGATVNDAGKLTMQGIEKLLEEITGAFDYTIIDSPAGLGEELKYSSAFADMALVVSTLDATSLRDAQRTVMELDSLGVEQIYLIANRVRSKVLKRAASDIDDMIDYVGVPLIGLVPEDSEVLFASAKGESLILTSYKKASQAFARITRRILGEKIPLKYR